MPLECFLSHLPQTPEGRMVLDDTRTNAKFGRFKKRVITLDDTGEEDTDAAEVITIDVDPLRVIYSESDHEPNHIERIADTIDCQLSSATDKLDNLYI